MSTMGKVMGRDGGIMRWGNNSKILGAKTGHRHTCLVCMLIKLHFQEAEVIHVKTLFDTWNIIS